MKRHSRSRSMDLPKNREERLERLKARPSLLSSESITKGKGAEKEKTTHDKSSNKGLVNLCILLLVLTNFRYDFSFFPLPFTSPSGHHMDLLIVHLSSLFFKYDH